MTPEEIAKLSPIEKRQKIAIACGWTKVQSDCGFRPGEKFTYFERLCILPDILPDYLHDLNAMHAAELSLPHERQTEYATLLWKMLNAHVWGEERGWWIMATATAAKHAEAFLLLL